MGHKRCRQKKCRRPWVPWPPQQGARTSAKGQPFETNVVYRDGVQKWRCDANVRMYDSFSMESCPLPGNNCSFPLPRPRTVRINYFYWSERHKEAPQVTYHRNIDTGVVVCLRLRLRISLRLWSRMTTAKQAKEIPPQMLKIVELRHGWRIILVGMAIQN